MLGREALPMPWKETCAMHERMRFVVAALEEGAVMTEVCERFEISRQTGYKWLERFDQQGIDGLKDRSRAPVRHGRRRPELVKEAILGLRERWPQWGPRKLKVKLAEVMPGIDLPAASTIGDWLRQEGLTRTRRRRRSTAPYSRPFAAVLAANDVWCTDFKGWFRTADGGRCDPLTITDAFSRALLCCQAMERPDYQHVRPAFEAAFCEFGLPGAIRNDNGPPFASTAAGGLSPLSVWWIKLGIRPERIEPGKPQQNGRHERLHRTLKDATARPPAATLPAQQAEFDRFRREFNEERPHEALGQKPPASLYRPAARSYPCPLREPAYDHTHAVRRVRSNGEIKWGGNLIFVSQVLVGEPIGIAETESGEWLVRYADIELGYLDLKRRRLCRRPETCGLVDTAARCPQGPQDQNQQTTIK